MKIKFQVATYSQNPEYVMKIEEVMDIKEEIESRLAPNQIYKSEIVPDDTPIILKLPRKRK